MEASLKASLDSSLKNLKLPTILSEYSEKAMIALEEKFTYEQYLLSLAKQEVEERFNKKIKSFSKKCKVSKSKNSG